MTTIKVIGSSSAGNGYIVESGNKALIIELGCKYSNYYDTTRLDMIGAICSHAHGDHINVSTAKHMLYRGVPIYLGAEVYNEVRMYDGLSEIKPLFERFANSIDGFTVRIFKVAHNVPNYGFLITTPDNERIVFVTDAIECRYKFKDIDCIMIECNHDDDTMIENIDNNEQGLSHAEYHLGLHDCVTFCKANVSPHLKQIILTHLSSTNINESAALNIVRRELPNVPVDVAHNNSIFTFDNDDF